jgi:hypothetical protein
MYTGPHLNNTNLIFGYDTGYPIFNNNVGTRHNRGIPTSNPIAGYSIGVYNNVPGNVSNSLEALSQTYQGAPITKQTLTPLNSTGVAQLSNGANPGIGVITGGGGGSANERVGFSIFFKPTIQMHSSPIFTNYSNIAGWQSGTEYAYVGDGWYRAYVSWYDTVTRTDGKYWAINPLQAQVNVPMVIYWAGPFREVINSPTVSNYTWDARTSTNSLLDITRTSILDVANVTFNSSNSMYFDGSNDQIVIQNSKFNRSNGQELTVEVVMKPLRLGGTYQDIVINRSNALYNWMLYQHTDDGSIQMHGSSQNKSNYIPTIGQYIHVVATITSGQVSTLYVNGTVVQTVTGFSYNLQGPSYLCIGALGEAKGEPYYGEIPVVKVHNIALTATEVQQNYKSYKSRFSLS